MTFSVVGLDPRTGDLGVAVASKFLAVGAAVPGARFGAGALASQCFVNTLYRRDGLALLAQGLDAAEVVRRLTSADDRRQERQLGVVDARGGSAGFTGSGAMPWAGGLTGDGVAIQGNILAGPEVVDAMMQAWLAGVDAPLVHRLLSSLRAGDDAGGDRRGRQSAAVYVVSASGWYTPGDDLTYDLRVDDHPDPVGELTRLLEVHDLLFRQTDEADLLPLNPELAQEISGHLTRLGQPDLATWAGIENLELRLHESTVDPVLLAQLRAAAR